MRTDGNTILITGGGSGIGLALADYFAERGNTVVIAGRDRSKLDDAAAGRENVQVIELDVTDPASLHAAVPTIVDTYADLNVVIHSAGIMRPETIGDDDLDDAEATIGSNLTGVIRLNSALVPHLAGKPNATVMTVSSGLAFLPRADYPTYCATKAAVHSYSQSMRVQLKPKGIAVIELVPPYVQTGLQGPEQASDPAAMPLADFIREATAILENDPGATEIVVDRARFQRTAESSGEYAQRFAQFSARFGLTV